MNTKIVLESFMTMKTDI